MKRGSNESMFNYNIFTGRPFGFVSIDLPNYRGTLTWLCGPGSPAFDSFTAFADGIL